MPQRNKILLALAILFGLTVLVTALTTDDAVGKVAIIGGVLFAVVTVVLRPSPGTGRQRNRRRYRDTTGA